MHLAIGSFISKNNSDGRENGKKKQCSGLKHNNNFSSPKEKTINKQTERMLAGTPKQLWPIAAYISLPLLHKYNVKHPDHFTFLGNCPPTPPLNQHFALSEK